MAYTSGTATGFFDLVTRIRDFLTTDAALVAAGQNWSVLYGPASGAITSNSQDVLLKGPGNGGTDEVLVALFPNANPAGDTYNLGISGLASYSPSAGAPVDQPGRLISRQMHLWNQAMPYWIVANGRRFIIVVRVTTVYQSAYAGFILPYHLPTTWAYPMYVGASTRNQSARYSLVSGYHGSFFSPGASQNIGTVGANVDLCGAALRLPDGVWTPICNKFEQNGDTNFAGSCVAPWNQYWYNSTIRDALDGSPVLVPAEISLVAPYPANMGALEGVYFIPGYGTGAENIVTVNGVQHLVVQNAYRTANGEYAAIALE